VKKENRVINISKTVRDRIRTYCVEHDVFMITVVEKLIEDFLERKGSKVTLVTKNHYHDEMKP